MQIFWFALLFGLSAKTSTSGIARAADADNDNALFRQNFEGPVRRRDDWDFSSLIEVKDHSIGGLDFGHYLKVSYLPSDVGSARIIERFDLYDVTSATLSFDVKLHRQFEFVKAGKMHGLGGGYATAGCIPIDPRGWSVRLMWKELGVPSLYVYHQDRVARCGDEFVARDFKFERDRWYRIDLQVRMNSSPHSHDGKALLYIDGEKLVEANDLRLSGNREVNIDKFLFSTFYGGSSSDWSPSKTTYVYYDNFAVSQGLVVTGERGSECELFLRGIYNPIQNVCCDDRCGSCGGSGCGSRECCAELIGRRGDMCDVSSSAPCKFESNFLRYIGNELPHGSYGLCEGDCDSDKDCKGNLVCQKRHGFTKIPGCDGEGKRGSDYCRHPDTPTSGPTSYSPSGSNFLTYIGNELAPGSYGLCEGDCDSDEDCRGALVCFKRDGWEYVPGCDGWGYKGSDHCHDPDQW